MYNISNPTKKSARLINRFRPDRAGSEEVVGVPAARSLPFCAFSLMASASSRASHQAMHGRIHVGHGRALSQDWCLRTVHVVLRRCDRLVGVLGSIRRVSVALRK